MSALEPVRPPDGPSGGRPRLPMSPTLAFRVAVIGGVALVLFGIVFFRLWYLQVLSGEQYFHQSHKTYEKSPEIPPPRGEIRDRQGRVLVESRTTNAVLIDPTKLPKGRRLKKEYRRLGRLIHMKPSRISEEVTTGYREEPAVDVTVKINAGKAALITLAEKKSLFPGVLQEETAVTSYPQGRMAAPVLGYTGRISEEEYADKKAFAHVGPNAIVGQAGLEHTYDRYLRGIPGRRHIEVNAAGYREPQDHELRPTPPKPGYNLVTTLDLGLQRETEKALRETIENGPGVGGAAVALDPTNGEVLALASYPEFNPSEFEHELTKKQYRRLAGECTGCRSDLIDRATESVYPTGSTFKPITAMGALEAGVISTSTTMGGGACVNVGNECRHNASGVDLGDQDVTGAIKYSEDTFFYLVGVEANKGLSIQNMAHKLGIGHTTGIDLGESEGLVPDARTVEKLRELQHRCERRQARRAREHKKHERCAIAEPDAAWTLGDNANLAVGQGELQTTPLQMAVAYSALADAYRHEGRGRVHTPHLGKTIEEPGGGVLEELTFPSRPITFNPANLDAVMTGLHEATSEEGGTSADVWSGWDQTALPVFGKTGTAERVGQNEQAWYICYIGSQSQPIVIAVTVEEGGYGDVGAAPIARLMAEQYYGKPLKRVAGTETDK